MKTRSKYSLVALAATAVLGCASTQPTDGPPRQPEAAASITQIGYGPYARFVTCPIAGCMKPTPKTLVEPPRAGPEPARTGAAVPPAPAPPTAAAAPLPAVAPTAPPAASAAAPVKVSAAADEPPKDETPQRVYINFPEGSARLDAEAREQLDRLVPRVAGAEKIVIKGRTDERGDTDSNDRLALRRAMAVYDHLKRAARAGDKPFKLLAKGACCYIARNDTEAGRAANRRAEVDFVVPLQASVSPPRRATSKAHSS